MNDVVLHDLSAAAAETSQKAGIHVRSRDLRYLADAGIIPTLGHRDNEVLVRLEDLLLTAGRVHQQSELQTLFGRGENLLIDSADSDAHPVIGSDEPVLIVFASGLAVSYVPDQTRPEDVQRFIATYRMNAPVLVASARAESLTFTSLGDALELVSVRGARETDAVVQLWNRCGATGQDPAYAESVSVPSLYGNKMRLVAFITGIIGLYLPEGSRILDAMCGTGIVARALARRFSPTAADANPYATALARGHNSHITEPDVQKTLDRLVGAFEQNCHALNEICGNALELESRFLHGHVDRDSTDGYREFASTWTRFIPEAAVSRAGESNQLARLVSERSSKPGLFPYCLVTAYFANAYFGVRQSIELDSLRYALDTVCPGGPEREFLMAVLLTTAVACASGPHFAQPPKVSGPVAMAELVEHRAMSVRREFETLARIATKRPLLLNVISVVEGDWRRSLSQFDKGSANWTTGIYVDPPYSKLQYSRYYHVLNTLVGYDYPACVGQGRYPERNRRFSSRFEYRPSSAMREFVSMFEACSQRRLATFVSYSNRGFVSIEDMLRLMQDTYPRVHVYSKRVRHHSQGVSLNSRPNVTEYLLVGVGSGG